MDATKLLLWMWACDHIHAIGLEPRPIFFRTVNGCAGDGLVLPVLTTIIVVEMTQ
jgi:predicted membrane protein